MALTGFKTGLLWVTLLAGVVAAGCRREPVIDQDFDADSLKSVAYQSVMVFDTMILTDPVIEAELVSFGIVGNAPVIGTGVYFIYPGSTPLFGMAGQMVVQNSRLILPYEKVGLDKLFLSLNIHDNVGQEQLYHISRIPNPNWFADTLQLNLFPLFDGMIDNKGLRITLMDGKVFAGETITQRLVVNSNQKQSLQRYQMDLGYEQQYQSTVRISAYGALSGRDSITLSSRVYGPFFAGPLPVFYRVDQFLGFDITTARDTVIFIDFSLTEKGRINARFNYWEDWEFNHLIDNYSVSIDSVKGPVLSGYSAELFLSRSVTPLFGGIPAQRFYQKTNVQVIYDLDIPAWQRVKKIESVASMIVEGNALGESLPALLSKPAVSLLNTVQSGVLENQPPKASFEIIPPMGLTNTNFEFNASASTDFESASDLLEVRWDFDNDNHYDTEFSTNKTIFRVFPVAGVYQVVLEVRDEGGLTARATKPLTVELSHSAPTAFFTVNPENGRTNNFFLFDASGSWDGEDNVNQLKVRWDFESDGIWDTQFSLSKAAVWVYTEPDNYVAKLEVKDTEGLTGSTTKLIRVDPANIKPSAVFKVSPESGTTETLFLFDASESSDPEDAPETLQVRWDWNGDGTWDTGYSLQKTVTRRFSIAGQYTVILEVADKEGFASTSSSVVPVSNPNTPPKADFTITPGEGTIDTLYAFDASISSDLEDSIDQLEVRWDWDNDDIWDTDFTTEKVFRRKFQTTGTFIIKVRVRDSGGLTADKARLVIVK